MSHTYALRMGEYVALEREHVQFVVDNMVPRPGMTILVGPPKAGKSFLTIQLAHALAHGSNFLGRQATKSRVLYLMLESELVFKDRIEKLLAVGYLNPNALSSSSLCSSRNGSMMITSGSHSLITLNIQFCVSLWSML